MLIFEKAQQFKMCSIITEFSFSRGFGVKPNLLFELVQLSMSDVIKGSMQHVTTFAGYILKALQIYLSKIVYRPVARTQFYLFIFEGQWVVRLKCGPFTGKFGLFSYSRRGFELFLTQK